MSDETTFEILAWYVSKSEPNTRRVYYECPICHATWHKDGLFGVERHNLDCWIPRLQGEAKAIEHPGITTDDMLRGMAEVAKMAEAQNKVCYLYNKHPGEYQASFQYWNDWIFKAYPGGRKEMRRYAEPK